MKVRSFADAVGLIMKAEGWTQSRLAKALNIDQAWISRASRGERTPGFNRAVTLLARVGWEIHITRKTTKDDPVKRREFIANAATVALIPGSGGNPYRDPEYVRGLADRMTGTLYEHGGVSSATMALRHIACVKPALASHDRRLHSAASELARQAMLVLYDAQRLGHAEYAGGLALDFARRAGDHPAQIDAYRELSMISAFQGKGDRGAMYAQRALQLPEITNRQRAFSLMRLGRALGLLPGHARQARHMLDQARGIDGLSPFQQADLIGGVGVALKEQREFTRAHDSLSEAVRLVGPMSPLLQANYLARQVQAALEIGDPSLAAELMCRLATTAPLVTSARLDGYMTEILTASSPWARVPEMRDARERRQRS